MQCLTLSQAATSHLETFIYSRVNRGVCALLKIRVLPHLDVPVVASTGDACGDVKDNLAGGVGVVWCRVPCRLVLLQPAQETLVCLQVHLMVQVFRVGLCAYSQNFLSVCLGSLDSAKVCVV